MKIYCGFGFNVDFQVVSYSLFLTKRKMINMIPWPLTQKKIMILINTDDFFFFKMRNLLAQAHIPSSYLHFYHDCTHKPVTYRKGHWLLPFHYANTWRHEYLFKYNPKFSNVILAFFLSKNLQWKMNDEGRNKYYTKGK